MTRKSPNTVLSSVLLLAAVACSGCTHYGPNLGPFMIPVPVSPYFQDREEDKFWEHERYERAPILGPLQHGGPVQAMDPPSDDQIIRALERSHHVEGGIPFLHEVHRDNVQIRKELIADYIDPPRFYPMIGPAQLHHAHYKCTVYFSETKRAGWPAPHTLTDEDSVEVIYIDHNHLHMVGNVDTGVGSNY